MLVNLVRSLARIHADYFKPGVAVFVVMFM